MKYFKIAIVLGLLATLVLDVLWLMRSAPGLIKWPVILGLTLGIGALGALNGARFIRVKRRTEKDADQSADKNIEVRPWLSGSS
jgi:hypothetical protein